MAYNYDYDDEGINFLYPLSAFFALGIWLVISRYHSIRNRAVPFVHRPPLQATDDWDNPVKIEEPELDAHMRDPALMPHAHIPDRKYITCYDPSTSYHLRTMVADNAQEIEHKIGLASTAQRDWSETTFQQRRRVMRSLNKWLVDNQESCARVAARDTGKTLLDAALGEILVTCSKLDWLIQHGERYLRPEKRRSNFLSFYKSAEVHYEPLGVVAAIVSWNYPLHNAWSPIIAALFAGNSVILKCSEQVIWSTQWYIEAIRNCLQACGHNPNVVQLVCCYPEDARALTTSPFIRHITFIGSETVGRIIVADAAQHLTPVTLELGGKDPAIILPSTDLDKYMSIWMRGVFQNAGQNCIGIERIIVHESQYDDVYRRMLDRAKELRMGSALSKPSDGMLPQVDVGAMISGSRFSTIQNTIEAAVNHGALVEYGGHPHRHTYLESAQYFTPTVVGQVTPSMPIAQTEMFAPIALIMKYKTLEEAVDIANGTRYGLGASVFGPDQEQCMKIARRLQCGMVSINDFAVYYLNQDLPFGGVKMSGYGRFGGPEGIRSLTSPKAVVVDRWPWLIQTTIPRPLDYPVRSIKQSWDFISGLIGFVYGDSWRKRIQSLFILIGAQK
ncbi:hypothetical protein NLI96_g10721 [Meripilus lineatus]|uniref:Aldehyde dehydrogenase domain-containing protein n=1 Tax=Meripilus lineatus TaxID=2056292 RepID=A0AAD5UT24_9APHY|nr:hypothetical protein NLI96_g10721 [Physisporinus lineatus]